MRSGRQETKAPPPPAYTPTRAMAESYVGAAAKPQTPILIGTRPGGLTQRAPTNKKRLIGGST